MSYLLRVILPPLVPLVVLIAALETIYLAGWVPAWLLPPPSKVLETLITERVTLWRATWQTLQATVAGLGISIVGGIVLAVVLSSSRLVQRAFYPYAVFFQTVPIIAIAPLLVIWFGFGMPTSIASSCIVSIFPVIAATLTGLASTDPALVDLFRLYGGSKLATLLKLRLPAALPNIFTGMRVAAGLAVIGAVVGEFIGGGGIGGVIDRSRTGAPDRVFAMILLASAIGLLLFGSINLASKLTLRHWHASEKE
jgi:NitT/TauT family transport system permease protein